MITGAHAIVYSDKADETRKFLTDVLQLRSVDAGGGWLVYALPPTELAVHPSDAPGGHELYLLCDDLDATMAELGEKGVEFGAVSEQRWGRLSSIKLPGGGDLAIYEPSHPTAF
ncbi:VOC family protein [Nucisporomicrobium flavum]|jgi:catechol 2,3-dioxygenase-like lactoylglutathione lyase family enzyme|uniref:VOC family protein n=1 Tax=Nucisporomicrobium flavum TaxID=2785915 RepID=UPI0018F6ABB1|nr:extradiol dioxygenase [Nucisporomicrobium flavum]